MAVLSSVSMMFGGAVAGTSQEIDQIIFFVTGIACLAIIAARFLLTKHRRT